MKLISRYQSPGRILDVGCGRGVMLELAQRAGWSCPGTEISEDTAREARRDTRIDIRAGQLELTIHGKTRVDDYYWLRHKENPDVLKYLQAQMDYLEDAMGHTKSLQERLFSEMKERIEETDSTVPEERGGYLYYERTEAGKQYPIFCRKRNVEGRPEEILLDQNEIAEGKIFCSVSGFSVSPDGNKLAYSVDFGGDETYTIHIKGLKTGSLYPETIPNAYGSVYFRTGIEWANDSETIFYGTLDESKRPFKLFRHKIGPDP